MFSEHNTGWPDMGNFPWHLVLIRAALAEYEGEYTNE
jgi:hypothetical protein